jgi:hypothetical protein
MLAKSERIIVFCLASVLAGSVYADRPVSHDPPRSETKEVLVFVTGSHIPQRVKLSPAGTTTVSPLRIIDRWEIDRTGRHTTAGALANEPSLTVIGH